MEDESEGGVQEPSKPSNPPAGRRKAKGSPVIPVRVPNELLALVDAAVARTLDQASPTTRSGWIIKAIEDRLAKQARSAKRPSDVPTTYARDRF
jgi:hypothetical protein